MSEIQHSAVAYVDGACRGNPGVGGWGVFLQLSDAELQWYGAHAETTNNQMELKAAIALLQAVHSVRSLVIYTDSQYVKNGIERWIINWKHKNWKTAANKSVKNRLLWQQLDRLNQQHQPVWRWVKGHSGVYGNSVADALANKAIDEYLARPPSWEYNE